MPLLTVATYNVHHKRTDREINRDILRLIRAGCHVIALQEMGGHLGALTIMPPNWESYYINNPGGGGSADIPILYDTSYVKLINLGERHVSDYQKVEYSEHGGGDDVATKTVTWIKVHILGYRQPIAILNTHAISSIESYGLPNANHPKRVEVFGRLMVVLTEMVRRRRVRGQHVIIAADLNVDYRKDKVALSPSFPYVRLTKAGCLPAFDWAMADLEGTHGNRLIDWVCATRRLLPLGYDIPEGYGSDHKPVIVTYEVPE